MAVQKGVGARLQLTVEDALRELARLQEKLHDLRVDANKPLEVKVVLDTSEFDRAAKSIKQTLSQSASTGSNSIFKPTELDNISRKLDGIGLLLYKILETMGGIGTATQNVTKNLKELQSGMKLLGTGDMANINKEADKLNDSISEMGRNRGFSQVIKNYYNIRQGIEGTRRHARDLAQELINLAATSARAVAQIAEALANALAGYRSYGISLLNGFKSFATDLLETIGFGIENLIDDAMEQEKKLQLAQIGFANMFPGKNTQQMIQLVRSTAAASPGLNSGDLADYINQLGAVSNGDFSTAFNATMGILKTVQYGGGDANSQMGYIIKNIRDVMAKGKATQIDVQQFNRAMPLLQKSLAAIGASEFLKNGELKITKDNADMLMQAFARLNTEDNPAYKIFEQTATTLSGLQEEFRETFASQIATMFENLGLFKELSNIMRGTVFDQIEMGLERISKWAKQILDSVDWQRVGETIADVFDKIKIAIEQFANMIINNFGKTEFFQLAIKVIGKFIEGLIDGATELGKFFAHIKDTMGEEGLSNLAESLGRAVTQGFAFQKALEAIATVFGGLASVMQTLAFGRYLTSGLRDGSLASAGGFSGMMGKLLTSKFSQFLGKAFGSITSGLSIAGLGSAISEAIFSLRLFGDASTTVANVLQSLSVVVGGAVMGSFLGLPGAIAGAVGGLYFAINEIVNRIDREEAARSEKTAIEIKKEGGKEFVDNVVKWYKDFSPMGAQFDEQTEAAQYVKDRLAEYVNNNNIWDTAEAQKLFVQAYRQILLHEAGVNLDNEAGFWDLQGEKLNWIDRNDGLQPTLTEYGTRLANVIRELNLVGYNSSEKLKNTVDETLVNEYLKTEDLNLAQLEYLENRVKELDSQIMPLTTDLFTEQDRKIQEAGNDIVTAIENENDENWRTILKDTLAIKNAVQSVDNKIFKEIGIDRAVTENTAKLYYGEELGGAIVKWQEQLQGWNGFWRKLGFDPTLMDIQNLMGTSNINQIFGSIFGERNRLEKIANNEDMTDTARENARNQIKIVDQYIKSLTKVMTENEGDFGMLNTELKKLALALAQNGNTYLLKDFQGDLNDIIYDLREDLGLSLDVVGGKREKSFWEKVGEAIRNFTPLNFAGGGKVVKPIYRASGGLGVDTVPAFLQPGEFVQRASAVSTAGLGVMNALNNGDLAAAYRMIGSKINGHWNNSRNTTNNSDNRASTINTTYIINRNRGGSRGSYNSWANMVALH